MLSDVSFLKDLQGLSWLNLSGNKLSDVSFLKDLHGLTSLDLSGNMLSGVSFLKDLHGLTWLNLSRNKHSGVSFLKDLHGLTWLDLSRNKLSEVSFLKDLHGLTWLKLHGNNLIDVSFLKDLQGLTSLDLSGNKLSDVSFIMYLPNLTYFEVSQNKVKEPPKDVIRAGAQAMRSYFLQMGKKKDVLYEAKVLLVGEPEAGKTSLMKKLLNPAYEVSVEKREESTLGVTVAPEWPFPLPKEESKTFKVHFWDFGGQNIQYSIHQFFLTESALYILLLDDRKDYPNIDYWFEIIRVLGKGSPVLVVRNEKNIEAAVGFDRMKYKNRYGEELSIVFRDVNLARDDGRLNVIAADVKEMASSLPHVGQSMPASWLLVRKEVAALREKNHIPLRTFKEICQQHGITGETDQLVLCGHLHNLGILLHYRNESALADTVFTNPQWITDAVYTILSDKSLENNGLFTKEWLFGKWGNAYTFEEKHKILSLMQKKEFDLIYKLESAAEESYITPQLLPDVAPQEANEWQRRGALAFRYRYKFMPKGIVSRLIVRLNDWIAADDGHGLVWKSGVILQKSGGRALIREDKSKEGLNIIDISVHGDEYNRKELLSYIRNTIEEIHQRISPKIPAEPLVPCNCEVCSQSDEPMMYEFSRLQKYIKSGEKKIKCEKGKVFRDVSIMQLLEGVVQAPAEIEREEPFARVERGLINKQVLDSIVKLLQEARRTEINISDTKGPVSVGEKSKAETHITPGQPEKKSNLGKIAAIVGIVSAIVAISGFTIKSCFFDKHQQKPNKEKINAQQMQQAKPDTLKRHERAK